MLFAAIYSCATLTYDHKFDLICEDLNNAIWYEKGCLWASCLKENLLPAAFDVVPKSISLANKLSPVVTAVPLSLSHKNSLKFSSRICLAHFISCHWLIFLMPCLLHEAGIWGIFIQNRIFKDTVAYIDVFLVLFNCPGWTWTSIFQWWDISIHLSVRTIWPREWRFL